MGGLGLLEMVNANVTNKSNQKAQQDALAQGRANNTADTKTAGDNMSAWLAAHKNPNDALNPAMPAQQGPGMAMRPMPAQPNSLQSVLQQAKPVMPGTPAPITGLQSSVGAPQQQAPPPDGAEARRKMALMALLGQGSP